MQQQPTTLSPQKQEALAQKEDDLLLPKNEDDSLLANKLDDPDHVGELLQAGDFETSESPQPKRAMERDRPPDFLEQLGAQPREREFTFSGKEDWDGK